MTVWHSDPDERRHPGLVARLDVVPLAERCGAPDLAATTPLPGRHLVAFGAPPDDHALALLSAVGRVRWLYRLLGIAEVDAADPAPLAEVPGVVGVVPAWSSVTETRGVVVGLATVCGMAGYQAGDPEAPYRHAPGIGYPIITDQDGRHLLDLDPTLELPTPPALVPVVNLSLGTTAVGHPTASNDVVNLATAAASGHVLVVVAAGNCGEQPGDSMSAWARPAWVLSVGATDDEAGTRVAGYSSAGDPGPDVVALGSSGLDPERKGTSFAAPRVTFLARLVVAALCQLGRQVRVALGEDDHGVPAIGSGIIDEFGDEIWWERPSATAFQALPLVGVLPEVAAEVAQATAGRLRISVTPALMRHVLLTSARPVPGAPVSEVGAGFVDVDLVVDRLAAVTGAELWEWFGDGGEPPPGSEWADLLPFDASGLHLLASVVADTGPTVKFDVRSGRWATLPALGDQRTEHPLGWPIDLTGTRW